MRVYDFNGGAKTIAATTAQTLIWSGADLPGSRVVAFYLTMSTATNTLADIDRIRVKSQGATIIDLTVTQLLAFLEQTSPANKGYATTLQRLTIPFFDGFGLTEEEQDTQQFPFNTVPSVEITTGANTGAGTAIMGWALTDVDPQSYPRYLSQAHAIAASATNGRMPFNTTGRFRGLSTPATGLNRLRLVVNGQQLQNMPGVGWAANAGDINLEKETWRGGVTTTTDPVWNLYRFPNLAAPGQSYVEADTGAGWSATGEIAIYDQLPQ